MRVVNPYEITTVILNSAYQGIGWLTARAAFHHVMTGGCKGFDIHGEAISWSGVESIQGAVKTGKIGELYCWSNRNVIIHPDQPCLRSATSEWPIPTIVLANTNFGYNSRRNIPVSTRAVYRHYRGVCAYCHEKIPFSEATKDHVYPRSKGGSNDDTNLILACRSCNNRKDSQYPYPDVNGKIPKAKPMGFTGLSCPPGVEMRNEWRPFVHSVLHIA